MWENLPGGLVPGSYTFVPLCIWVRDGPSPFPCFPKLAPVSSVHGWIGEGACPVRGGGTQMPGMGIKTERQAGTGLPGNGLTEDNVRHSPCASSVIKSSVNSDMQSQEETRPIHYLACSCTLGGDSSALMCRVRMLYFVQAEKHGKLRYGYWGNHYLSESY